LMVKFSFSHNKTAVSCVIFFISAPSEGQIIGNCDILTVRLVVQLQIISP